MLATYQSSLKYATFEGRTAALMFVCGDILKLVYTMLTLENFNSCKCFWLNDLPTNLTDEGGFRNREYVHTLCGGDPQMTHMDFCEVNYKHNKVGLHCIGTLDDGHGITVFLSYNQSLATLTIWYDGVPGILPECVGEIMEKLSAAL